jgi:TolB protein
MTIRAAFLCLFGVMLALCADAEDRSDLKHPDWHPSGGMLIAEGSCAGGIDLYAIDLRTGEIARILDGKFTEGYPRWFPDGDRIAFHRIDEHRNARILVAEVSDELTVTNLTVLTNGPFDIEPAPSPDGRRIAFTRAGVRSLDIAVLDIASREIVSEWRTDASENLPSWRGGGQAIVFHAKDSTGTDVWSRDMSGGAPVRMLFEPGPNLTASLSPDGSMLVYSSERDGDREIYLRDRDRNTEMRLTDRPGRDGYPRFSPDGDRIAWHAAIDDTRTVIRIRDISSDRIVEYSCDDW